MSLTIVVNMDVPTDFGMRVKYLDYLFIFSFFSVWSVPHTFLKTWEIHLIDSRRLRLRYGVWS